MKREKGKDGREKNKKTKTKKPKMCYSILLYMKVNYSKMDGDVLFLNESPFYTVTTNHAYEGDQYSYFHTLSILIYLFFK
jgi:hypothetical protein